MRLSDAATTHLIGRVLVEPHRLAAAQTGAARRSGAVDLPSELDVTRVALFAGLITMVRHNNDLFDVLPWTLRMLRERGLELAVFRDHFLAAHKHSKDPVEKIAAALDTFHRFAHSGPGRRLTGFAVVLTHEECEWAIRRELPEGKSADQRQKLAFSGAAVPSFTGPVRVVWHSHSPGEIIEALHHCRKVESVPRRSGWYLYHGDSNDRSVKVIPVSRRISNALKLIDSRSSCARIALALGAAVPRAYGHLRGIFDGLSELGVIEYKEAPSS